MLLQPSQIKKHRAVTLPPTHTQHTSGSSRSPGKEVTTSWQHDADTTTTGRDWVCRVKASALQDGAGRGGRARSSTEPFQRNAALGGSSQPQRKQMQSSITSSMPFHYQTCEVCAIDFAHVPLWMGSQPPETPNSTDLHFH